MLPVAVFVLSPPDVLLLVGVVMAALAVPLIMRAVPMNRFYGVRTRRAFASDDNWYALNAFGGVLFLIYGAALVIAGIIGRTLALPPASPWTPAFVVGPLLGIVLVLLLIGAYSRRLPG